MEGDVFRALVKFLLGAEEPISFLRCWNEGNFAACKKEWPEAPAILYERQALTEGEQSLRKRFEALASDSYNFRRSRRDCYVNPAVARDWKWFRLGAGLDVQKGNNHG